MNERLQQLVDVPGDIMDECAIRLQEWIDDRSEIRRRVPVDIRVSQATTAVVYLHIALLLGFLLFMPLVFIGGEPEDTTSMSPPTEATPAMFAVPAQESESDSHLPRAGPARSPSDQAAALVVEGATPTGDDDGPGLRSGGSSESEDENKNDNTVVVHEMMATTKDPARKMNGVAVNEEDEFAAAPAPALPLSGDEAATSATAKPSSVSEAKVSEDGSNSTSDICPPSTPSKKGLPMLIVAFVAGGLLNL